MGYSPWVRNESDTTERLSTHSLPGTPGFLIYIFQIIFDCVGSVLFLKSFL